jgi:hypothetical protein
MRRCLHSLRTILWAWLPHRCRFGRAWDSRRGVKGLRCRRCGCVVWFNVDRREGEPR